MRMQTMKDIIVQQSESLKNRKKELETIYEQCQRHRDIDTILDDLLTLINKM